MESASPVFYCGSGAPAWHNGIRGELRHTLLIILADSYSRILGIDSEFEPREVGEGVPSLLPVGKVRP
jgi:hypothetical protein